MSDIQTDLHQSEGESDDVVARWHDEAVADQRGAVRSAVAQVAAAPSALSGAVFTFPAVPTQGGSDGEAG